MSKESKENNGYKWECKECHRALSPEENMAYHLVDRILYGWCEPCFIGRPEVSKSSLAA